MAFDADHQLVVIGAGPGGYAAAFLAADLGMDVALIDAGPQPGGVCLNYGCIPSKALLHVAKLIHEAKEAAQWGIRFADPAIDLEKLRAWKGSILQKLGGGITQLAKKRRVVIYHARASFLGSDALALEPVAKSSGIPAQVRFQHAVVATGSVPAVPASLSLEDPRVMDSSSALELDQVPDSLLVVGGGYIGLELGQVYEALGSAVTVVELTSGLLPGVDRDLVRPLERRLAQSFSAIHLETKVDQLAARPRGIEVKLAIAGEQRKELFSRVLISVGRKPNTQGLGLERTGVKLNEHGFILVDKKLRTADPKILAIGDVAGEPMLAHKASHEAKAAIEALAGEPAEFDKRAIPAVVFTDPEIAWCGLTESAAKENGIEVEVKKFPWGGSGRALTMGRPDGLTKLVVEPKSKRILGVGVCGVGAGELIAEGVLAVEMGSVAEDLAATVHPHPTMSETIGEVAEAFLGRATHMLEPKK